MRGLTKDKIQELGEKLMTMRAWEIAGDANSLWTTTINCIRGTTWGALAVSKGNFGGHRGGWWWNG